MKILLFLLFCIQIFSQNGKVEIEKIQDSNLVDFISSLSFDKSFRSAELIVRFLTTDNSPGSAGGESGEITKSLYILTSEFGEYSNSSLIKIGEFYTFEIKQISNEKFIHRYEITFLRKQKNEKISIEVNLNSIKLL